jgi:PKD repeat protein
MLNISGFGHAFEIAGSGYQEVHTTLSTNYNVFNFALNRSTSSINLKRNFTNVATAVVSGISSPSYNFTTPNPLYIGKYSSANPNYLNGKIAEVLFYNTNLSTNDRLKVEKYLNDKYAPPVNLGRDTTITNNFCAINLTAPTGFTNYLWSTGETSATISVNSDGMYWLSATNLFGVTSIDTIYVNYPAINNSPNTNFCDGSSTVWDAELGSGYTYLWNTTATSQSIAIASPGDYFFTVTDGFGCTRKSDTLTFVADYYAATASLGNDTIFCSGNYIELVTNAPETTDYYWQDNFTAGQTSALPITSSGTYWLESVNVNGCVAKDTIQVTVSGTAPTVTFTGQNRCLGIANTFTDGSVGVPGDPVTSWTWDFGDGVGSSTAQNPSYIYSSPGVYTVELYALSQGGCGAYHTAQVEIYAPPVASYTHTGHCSDNVFQFTNQSTAGGAVINQYAWNFGQPGLGAMNLSAVQNPYRTFTNGGTFPMSLTVTDAHMCVDDTVMQVVIDASPIIDVFAADACTNAPIVFTNNTIVQAPALYFWNFGDNTNSVQPIPTKSFSTDGPHTITIKVTSAAGCITNDTIQMTVHPYPVPSFDLGPHCKGAYTEMVNTSTIPSGQIADFYWVVNQIDTFYTDTAYYEITSIAQQQIQLFTVSDFGCAANDNLFFNPQGAISANFTVPSTFGAVGEPFVFTNTSQGASNFNWTFGDGTSDTQQNPTHSYGAAWQDSTVQVQLIVSNVLGCVDSADVFLTLAPPSIDLEISNLYYQKNGTTAILGAQLTNKGTVPLTTATLAVYSEEGFVMTETWNGNLLPNDYIIYVFTDQPSLSVNAEDEVQSYYCVNGIGFADTTAENDLSNNEVCKNIEGEAVILKPIYPNPTVSSLTMGLIVPVSAVVSADLVDEQGRIVKVLINEYTIEAGEYTFEYDLNSIANGTYTLRFTAGGSTELHRLVVLH